MNSVKTQGGLIEEIIPSNQLDPSEIVARLEENFLQYSPMHTPEHNLLPPLMEAVQSNQEKYLKLYSDMVLKRHFGKWIPAYAQKKVQEAFELVDSNWIGNPVEDKMAIMVNVVQDCLGVAEWMEEQKKVKAAQAFPDKLKQDNPKKKWKDAHVWEIPPLQMKMVCEQDGKREIANLEASQFTDWLNWEMTPNSEGKTKPWKFTNTNFSLHEGAWYRLKAGDVQIDLGQDHPKGKACKRYELNRAFQTIAARGDVKIRGGAHTLLQNLLDRDDVTPSCMATHYHGQWTVTVGFERTRDSESSFWMVNGKLTMEDPNKKLNTKTGEYFYIEPDSELYIPRISVSELERNMSLLDTPEDLAIFSDEDEEYETYMNEEEEFLDVTPRGMETEYIDFTRFAEDDPELTLLYYVSSKLEKPDGLTMGDIQSQKVINLIYGEYLKETREFEDGSSRTEYRWRGGWMGALESHKRCLKALEQDPDNTDLIEMVASLEQTVAFYDQLVDIHELVTQGS